MAMYRPTAEFDTAMILLKPTFQTISGVRKKVYPDLTDGIMFNGSFKTYGGTETTVNGILSIESTAVIETWFRPEITGECRIAIAGTTEFYEIIGDPENINRRNQFLKFKVKRVKGGV